MQELNIIEKASLFAMATHGAIDQRRKYTNDPYFVHPVAVSEIVRTVEGHTREMVAAALLHDVVEDTAITIDLIYILFGPLVGDMVKGLTKISMPADGNRTIRKKKDREYTWLQGWETQTIKVADIIHNISDITSATDGFAEVFINEKRLALRGMRKADPNLINQAWWIIYDYDVSKGFTHD